MMAEFLMSGWFAMLLNGASKMKARLGGFATFLNGRSVTSLSGLKLILGEVHCT